MRPTILTLADDSGNSIKVEMSYRQYEKTFSLEPKPLETEDVGGYLFVDTGGIIAKHEANLIRQPKPLRDRCNFWIVK